MRAAIFDMDGVLVISNPAHLETWQEVGREVGLEITEELFYKKFSGRKSVEVLEELYPDRFDRDAREALWRRKEELFRARYASLVEPVPGVARFVQNLKREGLKIGLASSAPRENVDAIVRVLGLEGAFDHVLTGSEVTAAKPDPAIFQRTVAALGVSPDEAVVFEDSIPGVLAAVSAGTVCVGVSTSESEEDLIAAGARRVISDFKELDRPGLEKLL